MAVREYNVSTVLRFYEIKSSNVSSCANFAATILIIIFRNSTKFSSKSDSPQLKQKLGIGVPHGLPNNFKFSGN